MKPDSSSSWTYPLSINWVGFTSAPLRRALLGFAGFLPFYSAHFHGDREEVELTVNTLYPGT